MKGQRWNYEPEFKYRKLAPGARRNRLKAIYVNAYNKFCDMANSIIEDVNDTWDDIVDKNPEMNTAELYNDFVGYVYTNSVVKRLNNSIYGKELEFYVDDEVVLHARDRKTPGSDITFYLRAVRS